MAYIQVGGGADGAAGAAPSPSALRASGAEAKRTPERTNRTKQQGSQKVSKNFLGRGDVTEQSGRVALASRRKAKFTATRKRGGREAAPLNRLGRASLFPAAHGFLLRFLPVIVLSAIG